MPEMPSDMDAITSSSAQKVPVPQAPILRPYQVEGVEWLRTHRRAIIADKMGLGKTLQVVKYLEESQPSSLLIVAKSSAFSTWREHLAAAPSIAPERFHMCTYQSLRKLIPSQTHWHTIVYDESDILRNRKAKTLYVAARQFTSVDLFLVTGTPLVSGSAQDLWTSLNLIDPQKFSSYWSFVNRFCYVTDNGFGKDITGVRNGDMLRQTLKPYLIRRLPENVMSQLPGLTRQRVALQPTAKQARVAKDLEKDLMAELAKATIIVPNKLAALQALRKLMICPELLGIDDKGAALPALIEEVPSDEPFVVFTPYVDAVQLIAQYLSVKTGRKVYTMSGQQTEAQRFAILLELELDPKAALVCTIGIATSFSAPRAVRQCFFLGYDWTPAVNEQAEYRIYRPARGDTGKLAKYFVHEGSVDELLLQTLNNKQSVANELLKHYKHD